MRAISVVVCDGSFECFASGRNPPPSRSPTAGPQPPALDDAEDLKDRGRRALEDAATELEQCPCRETPECADSPWTQLDAILSQFLNAIKI